MTKKKLVIPLLVAATIAGAAAGFAGMVSAQTATTATVNAAATTGATAPLQKFPHVDGTVTAINGTAITLTEESGENSTTYTVDASGAVVMKNGATATLSGVAVGDKLFVQGTVNGTAVTATRIEDGIPPGALMGKRGGFGRGPGGAHGAMGTVTAINGSTITITGKDGKSHTIDAGSAKVEKVTSASLSNIAVGDTISVQGSVNGASVTATNILDGLPFGK